MKVKFKKLVPEAQVPVQKTAGAANFDFVCTRIEMDKFGATAILYFGLAVEFPKEYKMVIVPRSGITGKGWVQANSPGQVDSDYRGELQLRLDGIPVQYNNQMHYMVYMNLPYKVGDRVAQGFMEQVIPVEFEEAEQLSDTERGTGGFGSTGNK